LVLPNMVNGVNFSITFITPKPFAQHMKTVDNRFQEYYISSKYRGFCKLKEQEYKLGGQTKMVFTNGEKRILGWGVFKEAALEQVFNQIDKYYSRN